MEQEYSFSGKAAQPFISPLSGRPRKNIAEVFEDWRAMSAEKASGRIARQSEAFALKTGQFLEGVSPGQEVMDSFADFAAEFQSAKMHLDVHGLLSGELRVRLHDIYRDLVEAATLAVTRADRAIGDLDRSVDHASGMRKFIDLAKPRVDQFREFFLSARDELRQARKTTQQHMEV